MNNRIKQLFVLLLILILFPQEQQAQQVDTLSGKIIYPDSVGIQQVETTLQLLDYPVIDKDTTGSEGFFTLIADTTTVGIHSNHLNQQPSKTEIYSTYPNPFTTGAKITFSVKERSSLPFVVYNILGQQVYRKVIAIDEAGWYNVNWNSAGTASGIYFVQLGEDVEKMVKVNSAGVYFSGSSGTVEKVSAPVRKKNNYTISSKENLLELNVRLLMVSLDETVYNDNIEFMLPSGGMNDFIHILEEKLTVGSLNFSIEESDTLIIPKSTWQYATGNVADFENLSPEWEMWEDQNNLYLKTNDPNANGFLEAMIETTAPHTTKDTSVVGVNIADLVTLSGKIVDNDFYRKLEDGSTGPPIPGYVKVAGQTIYTNDGLFSVRLPPTSNVTLKAQSIVGLDTLSFESSHDYGALVDNDNVILHPVTFEGMEPGQAPLFKLFYYLVNDKMLNMPYFGKKYMDKSDTARHKFLIPRINDRGDTVSTALQDSVENYLVTYYTQGMQNPAEVVKMDFGDPTPIGEGGGQWIIWIRPNGGPASGGAADFNDDGIIDEAYVKLPYIGNRFFWNDAAEEILTGEAGPNNLNDSRLTDVTALDGSSTVLNGELYVFDHKLRHLGENYPPKEDIERILGNVVMIDP